MMQIPAVFVDSDVVISSLLSESGAAHLLMNKADLKRYVSNISRKELKIVGDRLNLNKDKLGATIKTRFEVVELETTTNQLKEKYADYTSDVNDTHIVAGTVKSKVKFLILYNLKHFKMDKIKKDFNITVTTPGRFLQYLRSLHSTD